MTREQKREERRIEGGCAEEQEEGKIKMSTDVNSGSREPVRKVQFRRGKGLGVEEGGTLEGDRIGVINSRDLFPRGNLEGPTSLALSNSNANCT